MNRARALKLFKAKPRVIRKAAPKEAVCLQLATKLNF
jgi:hypothetical protein